MTRYTLGGVALAVLAAGAMTLYVRADRLAPLVGAVGGGAVLVLAAALVARSTDVLPWAVALGGAEYAAFLVIRSGTIDPYAPLYGAGLLLVAELAYWSVERHVPSRGEGLTGRRASLVLAASLAAGGLGGLILTMAELSVNGGLALEILGVAAAVGALAVLARLARA